MKMTRYDVEKGGMRRGRVAVGKMVRVQCDGLSLSIWHLTIIARGSYPVLLSFGNITATLAPQGVRECGWTSLSRASSPK